MGNKCILCQAEAEVRVSFYEGGNVKVFYVCKVCAEYMVYRFLYLERYVERMEMEREGEGE
jgi:protein-arginine kinase activator protein McsA